MKITRIDETRWRVGKYKVEGFFHRQWQLAANVSVGGYEKTERLWHVAFGPFYCYIHREIGYVKNPTRYGFSLDWNIFHIYAGEDDWVNAQGGVKYWMWRDRLLDFLFGKTLYFRHKIDYSPAPLTVTFDEGDYKILATRERACWMRPRWPFRKVRESIDIDIPGGIPFAGKGESSYDCDDDAIYGMGSDGHDFEDAKKAVIDAVMRERSRYGNASPETIARHLGHEANK